MDFNIQGSVDVAIFAGQSNMTGYGDYLKAIRCDENVGYEFRSVGQPPGLVPVAEPFGYGEDREGFICEIAEDGTKARYGGMVAAIFDEYYKTCGRQLIGISASKGGTDTEWWKSSLIYDALKRLDSAMEFLKQQNITIGKIFVVWCQGESDGDKKIVSEIYKANLKTLQNQFSSHGTKEFFIVQIGHYNYIDYPDGGMEIDADYEVIRRAQQEICESNDDFIMAGSFEPYIHGMKDMYHYKQNTYNEVGRTVGKFIAKYYEEENV